MVKELSQAQWEEKWRREEDARALARVAEINNDPRRSRAAQSEVKRQMKELEKRKAELDKQKQAMAKVVAPAKTTTKGGRKK